MKILAIDTSSKICSVSILEDKNLIIEKNSNDEKTHSQKLLPLIKEVFDTVGITLEDINLIACCIGPGSFTGIRIGVSTIKAFADAKNIPVIGITSLESLAYNILTPGYIVSLIDAKNDNVYFSLHKLDESGKYTLVMNYLADNINNIITILNTYSNEILHFVGDGSITHKDLITTNFNKAIFAKDSENLQNSISVAKAGFDKYNLGLAGDTNTLSPIYLKKSQAERALDGEK